MKKYSLLISLFATFILCGGIMGYIKASSIASLVMSSIFAISLFFCSYVSYKEKLWGLCVASGLIVFLNIFFLIRFIKSFALFPAGVMTVLSTLVGIPLISFVTNKIKEKQYS
jgi:uncharacterized membrane protein (UPF0136 family)